VGEIFDRRDSFCFSFDDEPSVALVPFGNRSLGLGRNSSAGLKTVLAHLPFIGNRVVSVETGKAVWMILSVTAGTFKKSVQAQIIQGIETDELPDIFNGMGRGDQFALG
jgi:hypothetical protein